MYITCMYYTLLFKQLKALRLRILRNEKDQNDAESQLTLAEAMKKSRKERRVYDKDASRTGGGGTGLRMPQDVNPDEFEGIVQPRM